MKRWHLLILVVTMGATNAFDDEAGKGTNVLSGQSGQSIAEIARCLLRAVHGS